MAEGSTPIDKLGIEIDASAQKANSAIDKLASSLDRLKGATQGIDTGKLSELAKSFTDLASAMADMPKGNTFTSLANGLQALNNVDSSRLKALSADLGTLTAGADGIAELSQSMANMPSASAFNSLVRNIEKLNNADVSRLHELAFELQEIATSASALSESGISNITLNLGSGRITQGDNTSGASVREMAAAAEELTAAIDDVNASMSEYSAETETTSASSRSLTDIINGLSARLSGLSTEWRGIEDVTSVTRIAADSVSGVFTNIAETMSGFVSSVRSGFSGVTSTVSGGVREFITQLQYIPENISYIAYMARETMPQVGSAIRDALSHPVSTALGALNSLVDALGTIAGAASPVISTFAQIGSAVRNAFSAITSAIGPVVSTIASLGSAAVSAFSRVASGVRSAVSAVTSFAGRVASAASSLAGLAKGAGEAVIELAGIPSMIDSVNGAMDRMNKKLRTVTRLLTMMGLRKAFTAMFKEMGTAFEHLTAQSDDFAAHLNSLQAACNALSHSVAAVAVPLMNIFGGAIEYIISLLSTAVNLINQFLSALTGKTVYTTAKKGINEAADAISGAGGAAKAAKDDFTGAMDELNILDENDSGGGGAGAGDALEECYEELALDQRILDMVGQIRDAWANADFYDIGRQLGEMLRDGLLNIDWGPIQNFAWRLARSLATFLNGFIETEGLAESIGTTLGEAINTGLTFVSTFLEEFHWNSLGEFIGNGLNAMIAAVNWDLFGETLADMIRAKLEVISSAILTFDWEANASYFASGINSFVARMRETIDEIEWYTLGERIGAGLETLVTDIDWDGIGAFLGESFNAAVYSIRGFLENVNWLELGSDLMGGFNTLIGSVEWDNLGTTIGEGFNAVLHFIQGAITSFEWSETAASLVSAVNNFISTIEWADVGNTISETFKGILEFFKTAIAEFDWFALGEDIITFLGSIDWFGIVEAGVALLGQALIGLAELVGGLIMGALEGLGEFLDVGEIADILFDAGADIIQGLFDGILSLIDNIGGWLDDHVFGPFISAFKGLFGIGSPSTVMAEQGGYLDEGLLQGIDDGWSSIPSFFSDALSDLSGTLSGAWNTISNTAGRAWSGITGTISGIWNDLTGSSAETAETIENDFSESFENIDAQTSESWGSIESTFSNSCQTVSGDVSSSLNTIENSFRSSYSIVTADTSSSLNEIERNFSSSLGSVTSGTSSSLSQLENDFNSSWNELEAHTDNGWDTVTTDFDTGWETVTTGTEDSWNTIKDEFTQSWNQTLTDNEAALTTLENDWLTSMANINTGAVSGWDTIKATFTESVAAVQTIVTGADWQSVGEQMVAGIKKGWDLQWPELERSIRKQVADLVKDIEKDLDIGSPSGVFEDIAEFTVEGFNVGWENTIGSTYDLVDEWVDNLTDVSPIVSIGYDSAALDGYTPNLDTGSVSQALRDTITAQGTVVLTGGADIQEIITEAVGEAINQSDLFNSIEDNTRRQADKDETTRVNISGREIARVVKRQNQANGYSFSPAT